MLITDYSFNICSFFFLLRYNFCKIKSMNLFSLNILFQFKTIGCSLVNLWRGQGCFLWEWAHCCISVLHCLPSTATVYCLRFLVGFLNGARTLFFVKHLLSFNKCFCLGKPNLRLGFVSFFQKKFVICSP